MKESRRDFIRKAGLAALGLGSGGCSAFIGPDLAAKLSSLDDFHFFDAPDPEQLVRSGTALEQYRGEVYRNDYHFPLILELQSWGYIVGERMVHFPIMKRIRSLDLFYLQIN